MQRKDIDLLLRQAQLLTHHKDYVIIGTTKWVIL